MQFGPYGQQCLQHAHERDMNSDIGGGRHSQCREGGVCKMPRDQGVRDAECHDGQLSNHHGGGVPHDGAAFVTHHGIKENGGDTASHFLFYLQDDKCFVRGSIHSIEQPALTRDANRYRRRAKGIHVAVGRWSCRQA